MNPQIILWRTIVTLSLSTNIHTRIEKHTSSCDEKGIIGADVGMGRKRGIHWISSWIREERCWKGKQNGLWSTPTTKKNWGKNWPRLSKRMIKSFNSEIGFWKTKWRMRIFWAKFVEWCWWTCTKFTIIVIELMASALPFYYLVNFLHSNVNSTTITWMRLQLFQCLPHLTMCVMY